MKTFPDYEHYDALGLAALVHGGKVTPPELLESAIAPVEAPNPKIHAVVIRLYDYGRQQNAPGLPHRALPGGRAGDGFGWIRAAAACWGLVGLKPTRGRNTFAPYTGEGLGGCSTEHAVTLTVRDCAALLDATAGTGPGDPYAAPAPARPYPAEIGATPGRLRIAWTAKTPNGAKVERGSLDALAETVRLCTDLGHDVEAVDPEIDGAAVVPTFLTLAAANTVVNLAGHPTGKKAGPSDVERVTWATAQRGERVSAADYVRATQTMHRLGRPMAAVHSPYDVLLTPGLAPLPPQLGFLHMMLDDFGEYWRRLLHFSPF